MKIAALLLLLVNISASISYGANQLYRGEYTLGHEVNTFCPQINSQCYWLSPDTDVQIRNQLRKIYQDKSTGVYKPVCVTVQGEIDRESERPGFAQSADGLITVIRVYETCDSGTVVTHGDLQHHRWKLISLDNESVNRKDWPAAPVLDFGERLFVEGGDGCRKFSGFAELTGNKIAFHGLQTGPGQCIGNPPVNALFSIAGQWAISIKDSLYLILENSRTSLIFKLDDWR